MNSFVVFSLLYIFLIVNSKVCSLKAISRVRNAKDTVLSRKSRTTLYSPYQTGMSLGAAVAVPVDNGRFDIFLSYCIASGYGVPEYDSPEGPNPSPFQTIPGDSDDESRKRKSRNTILTRRKFYRTFGDKLKMHGLNGQHCVLKAICEASQSQFGDSNGVLGDIVHILFTPTTSEDEELPPRYYEAERNGRRNLCNRKYKSCPKSVFDLISLTE